MSTRGFISLMFTAALGISTAQQSETIAKPLTEKQRAKKETQLRKELQSTWDRWLH
jgi:hypothetical protein